MSFRTNVRNLNILTLLVMKISRFARNDKKKNCDTVSQGGVILQEDFIMKIIRGFIKFWDRFEWYLIGILLGIATFLCFIEVVRRAVFNSPTQWAEELIRYIVIFAVFIGVSSVTKKNEHIRMSVIINLFSEKKRRIIDIITASIGMVFSVTILISGIMLVADAKSSETLSEFGLNMPIYIPYLALPVGGGLMSLRLIGRIIDIITPPKENK